MAYTLVIVEDEPITRRGLGSLDWDSWGFGLDRTLADGQDALEWLGAHPADLVLTDIRMPRLDGLALCARLRQLLPETLSVLVSGYDEFPLAQQALRLGAFGYLLKPVDEDELGGLCRQAAAHLQRRQRERARVLALDAEAWLRRCLVAAPGTPDEPPPGLALPEPYVLAVLAGPGAAEVRPEDTPFGRPCWDLPLDRDRRLLVLPGLPGPLPRDLAGLQVGVSPPTRGAAALEAAYSAALAQLSAAATPLLADFRVWWHEAEAAAQAARTLQREAWLAAVDRLLGASGNGGLPALRYALRQTLLRVQEAADGQPDGGQWEGLYRRVGAAPDAATLARLAREDLWGAVLEARRRHAQQGEQQRLQAALDYIAAHYATDLSIQGIARQLGMGPSSFSRWFRQATGRHYVDHVTAHRIREARRYLESTDLPVERVGASVGYTDPHHFRKVFRRLVGLTPSAYRNHTADAPPQPAPDW